MNDNEETGSNRLSRYLTPRSAWALAVGTAVGWGSLVVIGLFALSLTVMLVNHFSMKKWERKALKERDIARRVAFRDPLTGVKSKHAFVAVFERADMEMYERKKQLKEMGAIVID